MVKQLGAMDAQFIYAQSPTNLTHVMAVFLCDPSTSGSGKFEVSDFVEHIESRLGVSPVFRHKLYHPPLDMDHPYWVVDNSFDFKSHITSSELPAPGSWEQLCTEISAHFSLAMDMGRPLWDIHLLTGVNAVAGCSDGGFAALIRLHHSAADGIEAGRIFAALCDIDASGTPVQSADDVAHPYTGIPKSGSLLSRAVRNTFGAPLKIGKTLRRHVPNIAKEKREDAKSKKDKVFIPDTRFNGRVSENKVFDAISFQLSDFKKLKSCVDGATVNDVALAVVGGALRIYLQHHREIPAQSLISWCPISIPPKDSAEAAANNLSGMPIPIGTDIEAPLERLQAVQKVTAANKASKAGASAHLIMEITQHIPAPAMRVLSRLMSSDRFKPKFCNLFVSNVPGSRVPLYMNGSLIVQQYGLAPLGNGMGLFITVGSYQDNLMLGIVSDENLLPDIAFFKSCIEDAFLALKEAAEV